MLPASESLKPEHKRDVIAALDRLTRDSSGRRVYSFADVSRAINKSASVVSQWYNDKYAGDDDGITRDINNWIERTVQRERVQGPKNYVETWVCETMSAHVRLIDAHRKMGIVVSPAGSGKDMVIEALCAQMNGIAVYCNQTTTARGLLVRIAAEVGLPNPGRYTADDLIVRISDLIRDRSTIVMVNEAQQLDRSCASVLRSLHDEADHVPIVLFGSKQIFETIRNVDKASGGGQFWSRCYKLEVERRAEKTLDPDTGQMGRRLFSQEEVQTFLTMQKVKLAKSDAAQVFQMLVDVANLTNHGTFRLLNDLVQVARDLYDNEPIDRTTVFETLELCLGSESLAIVEELEEAERLRVAA